ncbi:MAG TPA: NADH-quinone oxidoreductase subunit C [Gaiellales bacterium]|nr:NADH-quinone oxidoreductase subunit C [Gaiellales bacterium]
MTAEQLAAAVEQAVPGSVQAHADGLDMPSLTIAAEHLIAVCTYLRDHQGKNFLSAVTGVDYLGYGEEVAGYFGSEQGRDINRTGSWGTPETVTPPATRFTVVYHLAHIGEGPTARVRLQVLTEEGRVPSVVGVWPTADWHEREQYDMMGIRFDGHPNLRRLIMPSDWDGHPLRKDYPIGGEPVQFTDAV